MVVDPDGIYDPSVINDRLLLGLGTDHAAGFDQMVPVAAIAR
jgi:hypothetical protein